MVVSAFILYRLYRQKVTGYKPTIRTGYQVTANILTGEFTESVCHNRLDLPFSYVTG